MNSTEQTQEIAHLRKLVSQATDAMLTKSMVAGALEARIQRALDVLKSFKHNEKYTDIERIVKILKGEDNG